MRKVIFWISQALRLEEKRMAVSSHPLVVAVEAEC